MKRMGWVPNYLLGLFLLLLFFSTARAAPAQESKTYVSQKYGFSFQYPATYELQVVADGYFDFKKGSEFILMHVDDQFISHLYHMLHPPPHMVIYFPRRGEEDPYQKLARETQSNMELFHRYARNKARNWCSADGPDGSVYCEKIKSEKPFISQGRLNCLELYPVITREDYVSNTKTQEVGGPIYAVYLPQKNLPVLLMISPRYGEKPSPAILQAMQGIIDSIRVAP